MKYWKKVALKSNEFHIKQHNMLQDHSFTLSNVSTSKWHNSPRDLFANQLSLQFKHSKVEASS